MQNTSITVSVKSEKKTINTVYTKINNDQLNAYGIGLRLCVTTFEQSPSELKNSSEISFVVYAQKFTLVQFVEYEI